MDGKMESQEVQQPEGRWFIIVGMIGRPGPTFQMATLLLFWLNTPLIIRR